MIGATMRHVSAARRSQRRWIPALAGVGLVALVATACGSAGTTAAAPPVASNSPTAAPAQAAFPGAFGTAAAVTASSMEVQNPTSGQVTVTFTKATAITDEVAATSRDITAGSCVTVIGQPPASGPAPASGSAARSVTATTVTVSTPVNGNCGAGGPGGGAGFGGPRGTFSPNPSFSPRPRASGSRGGFGNGAFGGANGKVTSLSASGFTVQGRSPGARANPGASASPGASADITVTVTVTAATRYLKVVTASSAAFKVGECITAVGQANSIGAVAARTIRISQPGPNGCVTGFGRRGGPGGSPSGAAGNA